MLQVASAWGISLDNINCANPGKTRPFRFNMIEYVDAQEVDYKYLEDYNRVLEIIGRDPNGKMVEILKTLPRSLYSRSEPLTRFYTMKWLYKYGVPENIVALKDIFIPKRMRTLDLEYVKRVTSIPEVHSLHDIRMIENLVNDISYFKSIKMITKNEVTVLRDELMMLVDYMEDVTIKGHFLDTGNKLFFYVSHTWLETECFLYESKDLVLSMVKIMERNAVSSNDRQVLDKFMNMFHSIKRSSVLISASNILQRTEFYAKQRSIIMSLR
jgi:hypothetical protein